MNKQALRQFRDHHNISDFVKTEMHCPSCGVKDIWRESGEGDYYQGSNHFCLSCESLHYMDGCSLGLDDDDKGIVNQLKSGTMKAPMLGPERPRTGIQIVTNEMVKRLAENIYKEASKRPSPLVGLLEATKKSPSR